MIRTISFSFLSYQRHICSVPIVLFLLLIAGCGEEQQEPSKPGAKGGDSGKVSSNGATTTSDSGTEGGDGASTPAAGTPAASFETATPLADSSAKYAFTLVPRVGDVYRYRVTQRSSTQIDTLKGGDETVYNFHQKVTGLNDDGSITVEMIYDSIRFRINTPATPLSPKASSVTYSTQSKLDSSVPGAVQAKALIGKRVNMTIARNGEILEISNIEPIVSTVLGRLRDSLNARQLEQVRLGIKVAGFQAVVQQLYLRSTPDVPVSIGYNWVRRDTLPIGGINALVKADYRFTEARRVGDETVGRIAVGLSFAFPQKKFDTPQATIVLEQAEAGGSGDVLTNLRSGFPTRKSTRIDIKVRMKATSKAKSGPGAGESQTISQRSSQSSLVELLDYQRGS